MSYRYSASKRFWNKFYALPSAKKEAVRRAWKLFKADPFDPRLRTHRIHSLSAYSKRTIYAVEVEADLRVVFGIEGDLVHTIDIGTRHLQSRVREKSRWSNQRLADFLMSLEAA